MAMASTAGDDDPFRDPTIATLKTTGEHMNVPDTLAVGRNASLTLGTDSLIVLGTIRLQDMVEFITYTG
jgi:sphingosine kinase